MKSSANEFTEKHRNAIKVFMEGRGLNPNSWSIKADMNESTLRTYLGGKNRSIKLETLQALALAENATVSQLIGEDCKRDHSAKNDNAPNINLPLLIYVMRTLKQGKEDLAIYNLPIEKEAKIISTLYDKGMHDLKNPAIKESIQEEVTTLLRYENTENPSVGSYTWDGDPFKNT